MTRAVDSNLLGLSTLSCVHRPGLGPTPVASSPTSSPATAAATLGPAVLHGGTLNGQCSSRCGWSKQGPTSASRCRIRTTVEREQSEQKDAQVVVQKDSQPV